MSTFDIGDRIRLSASFIDIAGAASDPTEVTVKHRAPSGTVVSEVYDGGAGNVQRGGAGERAFEVRGSQFP